MRHCFYSYTDTSLHSLPDMRCPRWSLYVSHADADCSNCVKWSRRGCSWRNFLSNSESLPGRGRSPHANAHAYAHAHATTNATTNASAVSGASDRGAGVLWWNLPMQRQGNKKQGQETSWQEQQEAPLIMRKSEITCMQKDLEYLPVQCV